MSFESDGPPKLKFLRFDGDFSPNFFFSAHRNRSSCMVTDVNVKIVVAVKK